MRLNYGITANSLFKIAELDNTRRSGTLQIAPRPPLLTNASDRNRHGKKEITVYITLEFAANWFLLSSLAICLLYRLP